MKYLWMKQSGEGCDYMIGCGNVLVELDGRTVEEVLEDYSINEEGYLSEAMVLTLEADVMPMVLARVEKAKAEKEADIRQEKEAEFERLKRELGK